MKTKALLLILSLLTSWALFAQQPKHWKENSPSNFVPMTISQESTVVSHGTKSVKLIFTETGTPYYESDFFPVSAGVTYSFSLDFYDNDPGGEQQVRLRFYTSTGTYITEAASTYTLDSTGWQTKTLSGTTPSNAAQALVRVRVLDVAASWTGSATFYLDNATYTQTGSTTNPILNPSFEDWAFAMTRAYAVSPTAINIEFNGALTSINAGDYTLYAQDTITFSTATISTTQNNVAHLTGASMPALGDGILDSVVSISGEVLKFYAGITPLAFTNVVNPGGVLDEVHIATFKGRVAAKTSTRVWIADTTGSHNACNTYSSTGAISNDVAIGDEIIFTGIRSPYDYQTEIIDPALLQIVSTSNNLYGPNLITGSEISLTNVIDSLPAEKWEGVFVEIEQAEVISFGTDFFILSDDGGTTQFRVGDRFAMYDGTFGAGLLNIAGIYNIRGLVIGRSGDYHISMRGSADFDDVTSIAEQNKTALSVYPNPATGNVIVSGTRMFEVITILDLTGKMLFTDKINQRDQILVNLADYPAGMYFLKLTSGKENTIATRLIKH